jgi:hypothetical protein
MTKPAQAETPKAAPAQPATPTKPAPGGFGEGLDSPRSVHC